MIFCWLYSEISFSSELGKGRFGVVYLVQDQESQQHYAAKFQKTRKRSYKERAEEEISILKSLSHENIIKYVDCYADMTSIVILMEYLDGGDLFVKISDEDYALTEADCVHFVSQICHGVQYMHHSNVVHLDLKVIFPKIIQIHIFLFSAWEYCLL